MSVGVMRDKKLKLRTLHDWYTLGCCFLTGDRKSFTVLTGRSLKSSVVVFISLSCVFVYYEELKRDLKRILIYECRCDERLRDTTERSTRLGYTGFLGGLEHPKI